VFCERLGRTEWITDQYAEGERRTAMIEDLREIFRSKSSTEWLNLFDGSDACVTLVRNVAEVAVDYSPVIPKLSETPGR